MGGGDTSACKRWSENKRYGQDRERFQEAFHTKLLSISQSFFWKLWGMQRDKLL